MKFSRLGKGEGLDYMTIIGHMIISWDQVDLFMNYSWTVHEIFMNSQVHELKFMNSKFMNLTNFMNLAISCSWIVHELFMNKCSWTAH